MSDVTLYGPPSFPKQGYYFTQDERGWFWSWHEGFGEDEPTRERFETKAQALRDAADDWDQNGSEGRLSGTLRGLATKLDA